jgi:hypothetical protein
MVMKRIFSAIARPWVVFLSVAATVSLMILLRRIDNAIAGDTGMGVLYLQLSFLKEFFVPVVASWGNRGIDIFLRTIWLDFVLPPFYALLLTSFYALVAKRKPLAGADGMPRRERINLFVPAAAALCDYCENCIHVIILWNRWFFGWLIAAGSIMALMKWALLAYMVLAIMKRYMDGSRNPGPV